jgi:hypothetical protein
MPTLAPVPTLGGIKAETWTRAAAPSAPKALSELVLGSSPRMFVTRPPAAATTPVPPARAPGGAPPCDRPPGGSVTRPNRPSHWTARSPCLQGRRPPALHRWALVHRQAPGPGPGVAPSSGATNATRTSQGNMHPARDGPELIARRLYEGGGGCQGGLGRGPRSDRRVAGRGGSGQAPCRQGLAGAGVLALDAAGRVWQWVRVRGLVGGGEQRLSLYRLIGV